MKTFLEEQTPPPPPPPPSHPSRGLQYLRRSTFSPKSLFGASNGLKELPEMRFEVLFNLIGKSRVALYRVNHGAYSHPGTQVVGLEKGFWRSFTDGLNQSLRLSVAQATPNGELTCRLSNVLLSSLFQMLAYSVGVEFQRAIQVLRRKEIFLSGLISHCKPTFFILFCFLTFSLPSLS